MWGASSLTPSIVVVGNFPPPVHGASVANAAMVEKLRTAGADPYVVDIAGVGAAGSRVARAGRVARVASGLARVIPRVARQRSTMYISLNGGAGQAYDLLFLLAARPRGTRLFLHHHSFSYLNRSSSLTALLASVAGRNATHVVLCEEMSGRLRRLYPAVRHVRVVSNTALMNGPVGESAETPRPLKTIGFLGTVSAAKGIGEFLDVVRRTSLIGIIAGPFGDRESEVTVRRAVSEMPGLKYAGALDQNAKDEFLKSIDVLLFPSTYVNEAEPLVILEALSFAVPVIANARGCIRGILSSSGAVVDSATEFPARALELLTEWQSSPSSFSNERRAARRQFDDRQSAGRGALESVIREIISA